MRWALEPEQEMFQKALSGWLDKSASPAKVRSILDAGDASEFEASLAEEGWLVVGVSEELDGQGGGLLELALTAEQLARSAAPSSAWLATVLALPALDRATLESVVAEGDFVAIVSDANRPLDAPNALTVAEGTISGFVDLVVGAESARHLVVPVAGDLYLVDADADGVAIERRPLLDRSRSAGSVTLAAAPAVKLDADCETFLSDASSRAAVLIAADSLGAATRMRELAVEYSKQRTQFGAPIGSFQAVKHAAAMMLVGEEAARSLVYYAAASVDSGAPDAALHAAAAKAQATTNGSRAAESSLTMHGAIGYTWEHDLQLFYKRAKLDQALFGSPELWNGRIAAGLDLIPS